MKILHVYPKTDEMVAQHVTLLMEGMQHSAELQAVSNLADFKTVCKSFEPDIVHCHGCWQYGIVNAGNFARKQGARIVLSPHGQLEPWVFEEKPLQEKFHKTALWQKPFVEKAYALIAFGKMEQQYLEELKWNPRIEVIHNAVITNSTTREKMCSQTFSVYQKVLDSNVLEQMDEATQQLMATIIKAGTLGDRRWVELTVPETVDWRRMLIYAEHQNIRNYVDYGINILGLSAVSLDTEHLPAYFPESYQRPKSIKNLIDDYKGDETDYLLRMIRQIEKQPLLLHLIELTRELYRDTVNDDLLQEVLEEKKLTKFASRLMQVLHEQTLLDEGYLPIEPLDDRGTHKIRESITNHLKI
jgi:glycosyltransferase involved in cell wall biosynthesis